MRIRSLFQDLPGLSEDSCRYPVRLSGWVSKGKPPHDSLITSLKWWKINYEQVCQIEFRTFGKVCTHLARLFSVRKVPSEGQLHAGGGRNQLWYPTSHLYRLCFDLALVFFNGLLLLYRHYANEEKIRCVIWSVVILRS